MPTLNWKAAERYVTTPSPFSERALANVKFRLEMIEAPGVETVRHIETLSDWERLTPELFVDVDVAALTADTKLTPDDIVVSVIVRDRNLNKFETVHSWPLDQLPEDAWSLSEALKRFSLSARLDVIVVATPQTSVTNWESTLIPQGTLLSSKNFEIRIRSRETDFPFKFVEPEDMAKQGIDRGTVCYVRWKGEDVHRTPSELIEVWLNKELEDKFCALSAKQAGIAADHIGRNIAAQVYADLLTFILTSDEDGDEPTSLVRIVKDVIERELEMTLDEARQVYRQGPEGRSKLVPWCWKLTSAHRTFAALTF